MGNNHKHSYMGTIKISTETPLIEGKNSSKKNAVRNNPLKFTYLQ